MTLFVVVVLVIKVVLPLVALGGIGWLVYRAVTQRPATGWPAAAGAGAGAGAGVSAPVWQAAIIGGGGWSAFFLNTFSSHGELRLVGQRLLFVPDGEQAPAWELPCTELAVRRTTLFESAGGALVMLEGPVVRIRLAISRERINRWVDNGFKDIREMRYADEFVAVLVAAGARHG